MKDKQKRKKERTWAEAARMVSLLLHQLINLCLDVSVKLFVSENNLAARSVY